MSNTETMMRLSEELRKHPQTKAMIGREALLLRCVEAAQLAAAPVAAQDLKGALEAAKQLWNGTGEQLEKADNTLRAISSYLGQGGCWDTENLDYDEMEARIREGIDTFVKVESSRAAQLAAPVAAPSKSRAMFDEFLSLAADAGITHLPIPVDDSAQSAPVAAQEPVGWRDFLVQLSRAAGGMVNGNRLSRAAKELLAARPAQGDPVAPAGYKLAPIEPTPEMCKVAVIFANGPGVYENCPIAALEIEEAIYGEAYCAMLAAAPTPPETWKVLPSQALSDAQLLEAFNRDECVIDGLHEVVALIGGSKP